MSTIETSGGVDHHHPCSGSLGIFLGHVRAGTGWALSRASSYRVPRTVTSSFPVRPTNRSRSRGHEEHAKGDLEE